MVTEKGKLLPLVVTFIALLNQGRLTAQPFNVLHSFSGGADGGLAFDGLVASGSVLYGATSSGGGPANEGVLFSINTDGSGFQTLHSFAGNDGSSPRSMVIFGDTLFGTTTSGGASFDGIVFAIKSNGTGFTNLHTFSFADGSFPEPVIVAGGVLYSSTFNGGTAGNGTIFSMNVDGSSLHTLKHFSATVNGINSDGKSPNGSLVLSDNTLFGVTEYGGDAGEGAIYSISTSGTGFKLLKSFSALTAPSFTNVDGATPARSLSLSGNTLYGLATSGGQYGYGTIFSIQMDGTGFTVLHAFTGQNFNLTLNANTNSDGADPTGLALSGNTLYGSTSIGGNFGQGTIFSLGTNGANFTVLKSFPTAKFPSFTNTDGAVGEPPIVSHGALYGVTLHGGSGGNGTVFRIQLSSPPTIIVKAVANTDGTVTLQFVSSPGSTNCLQTTVSLNPEIWGTISTNVAGADGTWKFTDIGASNLPARYFRSFEQ